MGNIITAHHDYSIPDLVMSNGLTSVFLSVLLLSGSEIAQTDWEVASLVWLAEHDQGIVGSGTVGFDVWDLVWTYDGFAEQRAFLLRVVDGALARHGWVRLDYQPPEELLFPALVAFREMVASYPSEYAHKSPWESPWAEAALRADRATCPRHGVYLHSLGESDAECCIVCNDT